MGDCCMEGWICLTRDCCMVELGVSGMGIKPSIRDNLMDVELTKIIIAYVPPRGVWEVVCCYADGDRRHVSSHSLLPALEAASVLAEQLGAGENPPLLEVRGPVNLVAAPVSGRIAA